jgi:lactoylglutathione lyase
LAVHRVDYVIRYVRDLEQSLRFYRDVLGLRLKLTGDGYAEFQTDNVKLGLYERGRLPELLGRSPEAGGPEGEIVFVVEDVDAWKDRLLAAGITVLTGPTDRPWGHRTLHLSDPDGLVVELAQEIPRMAPRSDG